MTLRMGLWIDHKQAVIVSVGQRGETVRKIESGAKRVEYRGAPRAKSAYSARYGQGDDQLDKQYLHHLNRYYGRVIAALRGATDILILGPGEAKTELKVRLAREKGARRAIRLQPADKMTDRQIVARARRHFQ